ncbi:MAG: PD-(D/E)XK nuclease family protein [Candidatus Promineifilaceae bacterium]
MTKQLIVAPAAGGKTTYAIKLARETAGSLQAEVRVCVPTGLQARAWRRRLAESGGAIGIHVLTFDRLVAACLNASGEAYTELSEPVQYRLLRKVILESPLHHYAPISNKPGFVQVAARIITELKSALVDPLQFEKAVISLGDEARLKELGVIYAAYQEQLQKRGWADRVGLHWLAVEALQERATAVCRDWPLVIFDGFDDFSPSQLALMRIIADRAQDTLITLTEAESVTFPRYNKTLQAVEESLRIRAQRLPVSGSQCCAPLRDLARQIFALTPAKPRPAEGSLILREVPDRAAEVRTALRWLKQRIVWEDVSPGQTALLARELQPYHAYIQQIAAEFGLPIYLAEGAPLANSPVIASILELLRLHLPAGTGHEADLPRRQVISTWRSPYFDWGEGGDGITASDADLLDTLAREQRVIRGRSQWEAAFEAGMAARDEEAYDEEENEGRRLPGTAVSQLHQKFERFLALTRAPTAARTMKEFVGWLERLIGPEHQRADNAAATADSLYIAARARDNPETAGEDAAALRALKGILRSLVWAEESIGESDTVTYVDFFYELLGAISSTHFTLPHRAIEEEILVANVTQARGLSFEAVAVLGLSEGSFPQTISEDPFLRDEDRAKLHRDAEITLGSSTQSAEREFFYEAITRPRQQLLLTRPILADNGAEWVASPYWEAVGRLIDSAPEKIGSEELLSAAETASWPEWWETAAAANEEAQAQKQDPGVWRRIQTAAHIWRERAAANSSQWDGDLSILAAALADEHGPQKVWSASRLELYQTCAFAFYTRYVLGLSQRPEPVEGLDMRQLGSLYHNIFEQAARIEGVDFTDETAVREAVAAAAAPILDAAPEEEGFRETPWWEHTRREIIDNVTSSIQALAGNGYEFLQAEASFGFTNSPLVITDSLDQLKLHGFIDRIDRGENGQIRLIDYKLGGKSSYSARYFRDGRKLQLPLYALAAQEVLGLGAVEDGFYWHFRNAEASPFNLAGAQGGVEGAIDTALAYAWEAVRNVRDGRFAPRPPDEGCPSYCPAAAFCWHYTPSGW